MTDTPTTTTATSAATPTPDFCLLGVPQSTRRVARRIANQGDVTFSASGSLLTVSITATSAGGTITESSSLKLSMRVR